jgi:hypothetical protein
MTNEPLLPLVARLKNCQAHDANVSRELFLQCWDELRRADLTPFSKPTVPVMAALVLHDDGFGLLLNEAERTQLLALVKLALDRYEQETNPPNQLGKLLAGIITNCVRAT